MIVRGIEQHLGAWFAIALAVLVANAGLSYWNVRRIDENSQWVIHTHEVLGSLEETQTALLEAEAGQRGYLISGDERHLERYRDGVARLPRLVARLQSLTVDNPTQQARIDQVKQRLNERLNLLHEDLNLKKEGKFDTSTAIVRLGHGRVLMNQIKKLIGEMRAEETHLLGLRDVASRIALRTTIATIAFASLVAIVLLAIVFSLFHRDLRRRREAERVLRNTNEELDARVRERTADLVRANETLSKEIRERKEVEANLRLSEERLRLLVESASDYSILMLDPAGYVVSWNPGVERIKGYKAEEILGAHFSRFHTPEDIAAGQPEHCLAMAAAEGHHENEGWRVRKDGSRFWANVVLTALRDEQGRLRGFAKVTRDFSERRRAELELRDYAARLQRSNRELQEFATVASHDLQEPLRKIQAFGDRLQTKLAGVPGELGRDDLARIQSAATRMRGLIDDLLTFSRVTMKANPFTTVDLGRVAREVVSDLESRIQQLGGRVDLGELPVIDADPTQMRQLLQNLIGNGLKFHSAGAPPVVAVSAELSPIPGSRTATCQIIVRDNGIGFDEKYLDRIFKVFERLHARGDYEGTGMGLAICRKIVEWHGGTITAQSAPGQGATFIVSIPVQHTPEEKAA